MKNSNGKAEPHNANGIGATYTVEPEMVEGCACEDCRTGRHVYSLYRWTEEGWDWCAISLQSYSCAGECKRKHWWGIVFGPNAVWEDGQPVVEPDPAEGKHKDKPQADALGMVRLDKNALRKSLDLLKRHWRGTTD